MQTTLEIDALQVAPVIHLTMCGPDAGKVLCGAAKNETDKFCHAMWYHHIEAPDTCPTCRAIWESDED